MNKPDKPETNGGHKKAYSKPELVRFPLRPEEAVLGSCKRANVSGPFNTSCTAGSCNFIGS
jgi:hypothetical protein